MSSSVRERLSDPAFISPDQRYVVEHPGNFFLNACPGSGKTRTLGVRAALAISESPSSRLALTSYTNVAIEEIQDGIRNLGVGLDSRHFAGTLHEFLTRFVLRPFANVVGISGALRVIADDEWRGWPAVVLRGDNKLRISVGKYHFGEGGNFTVRLGGQHVSISEEDAAAEGHKRAQNLKKACRKSGLVSASDALFYTYAILKKYPEFAAVVADRFTELIVDEAQDTSDVQLGCLRLLHQAGLASLGMSGDVNQSIYSFQGARPNLWEALVDDIGLERIPLKENYRSSQRICDVTCRFVAGGTPDAAVGENAGCGLSPEVLIYHASKPHSAREAFKRRLDHHQLTSEAAVILTRKTKLAAAINMAPDVKVSPQVQVLGQLAAGLHNGALTKHVFTAAQLLIAEMAFGTDDLDTQTIADVREATVRLGQKLLPFEGKCGTWIPNARTEVKNTLATLTEKPQHLPKDYIKSDSSIAETPVRNLFAREMEVPEAVTIHAVKGESYESVLLVAEPKAKRGKAKPQVELWQNHLAGEKLDETDREELRIVYVALTRAQKYCAIAIPDDTAAPMIAALENAGFQVVDT